MKVRVNPTIFREDDIRGVVGSDLTPAVAEAIARAYATYCGVPLLPFPRGGRGCE